MNIDRRRPPDRAEITRMTLVAGLLEGRPPAGRLEPVFDRDQSLTMVGWYPLPGRASGNGAQDRGLTPGVGRVEGFEPREPGPQEPGCPSEVVVSVLEVEDPVVVPSVRPTGSTRAQTEHLLEAASTASPEERNVLLEQVIETNMRMAAQVASRYARRGVPVEDLQQVAYMALIKAVHKYECGPDRNFMAYAVPTIRGELRKYFRDLGWSVRPTRRIQETQGRIRGCEDELVQALGRPPRPSEIAEHLDLEVDTVIEALSANGLFQPSSLDAVGANSEEAVGSHLGVEETGYRSAEARVALAPVLSRLSERDRVMLEMRFWHGATQAEIGEVLGVTQMQVSRLLSNLMARLRDELDHGPTSRSA